MIIKKIKKHKSQFLIVVKKKIFKKAVVRNKIKRRIKSVLKDFNLNEQCSFLFYNINQNEIDYKVLKNCIYEFFNKKIEI